MSEPFDDPTDQPVNHPLLGRRVTVVAYRDHDTGHVVTFTGVLVKLTKGGDFDLQQDDGIMRYGWPALEITEAEEP